LTDGSARDHVRLEDATAADAAAIRDVHVAAFATDAEADLVERAGACGADLVSIVARLGTGVVGHLLVTPVTDRPGEGQETWTATAIGPIGVLPSAQHDGVGTILMRAGIDHCRILGFHAIFLLGEPAYYTRFGFVPAHGLGYSCKWDEAGNAFMVLQLDADAATPHGPGRITYHEIFDVF